MTKWRDVEVFQSSKMEALGQLAGGVAHDFNNVLSIIEGYARLIKQHIPEDNPAYQRIDNILEASRRGTSLTRRLLAFGRQKVTTDSCCDINKAIHDHEILLKPLLMPRVKIEMDLPEGEVVVACDRDAIWQILLNTAVNSRDAMPDGGVIQVKIRQMQQDAVPQSLDWKNGFIELVITDNGMGMSPEVADRAFEPFFTTKEQGKGTGLGLPMIYGLVQNLGGKVTLKTAEGLGTSVSVYLPISLEKPKENSVSLSTDLSLKGRTILIAEDEYELLNLNKEIMERMGMKVLVASDGNEALSMQDSYEHPIDLLLTDLIMPNMDGAKLAEMVTSQRDETAVVYITGYPARDRRLENIKLPDNAIVLSKPADPADVERALKNAIQIKVKQNNLQKIQEAS